MTNMPDKLGDGDEIQRAVSRRVARLATMPGNTSGLDAALRRRIECRPGTKHRPRLWLWWAAPLTGVAAAIIVMVVLVSSATPQISAADLAGVYSRLTATNQPLPGTMNMPAFCQLKPGENGMCCRQMVDHLNLTCIRINTHSGQPVVMVMAKAAREKMPMIGGDALMIAGHPYTLTHSGNLNMVMRIAGGKWFCAMGTQKPATLAGYLDRAANGT